MQALPAYDEPTKALARTEALFHAVALLTSRRQDAAILDDGYVEMVRNTLAKSDVAGDRHAAEACRQTDIDSWRSFRADIVGTRKAGEITVAYLAGPRPTNDLLALVGLGVRPENIWAFEVDASAVAEGLSDLDELGLRGVKFIPIRIDRYLIGTPRRFDLIYIDACGPLPSHDQRTQKLIVDIFRHGCLAPLGVLITNFSRPNVAVPAALDQYAALVAAYLFPKIEDAGSEAEASATEEEGEEEDAEYPLAPFERMVRASFDEYYGEFITSHLLDIAAVIAPTARLIDAGLHDVLFENDVQKATAVAGRFARFDQSFFDDDAPAGTPAPSEIDGAAIMTPWMFSLIWTLAALGLIETDENFAAPTDEVRKFADRWLKQLSGSPQGKPLARDVISAFYAWRFDQSLWSPAMRRVADFAYRDLMPFLCDAPNRELGFYAAFAQLAYPAHGNLREARRFRYVAEGKETPMFMDVIAFDECRYVYDWLSAVHMMPDDWYDVSAQLTFRFALDGIVKERQALASDFLFGCHAIGIGDARPEVEFADRTDLSPGAAY